MGVRIDFDPSVPAVRHIRFEPQIRNTRAVFLKKSSVPLPSSAEDKIKQKPVIYLLLKGNTPVYVGETATAPGRLRHHKSVKRGWDRAIVFFVEKLLLNKSITPYCEHHLFHVFADQGIALKQKEPAEAVLDEDDNQIARHFIQDIIDMLLALGIDTERSSGGSQNSRRPARLRDSVVGMTFYLKSERASAEGVYRGPDIVVMAGATGTFAPFGNVFHRQPNLVKVFGDLIAAGAIEQTSDQQWILRRATNFTSTSLAASILNGFPSSGPGYWKDGKGRNLSKYIGKKYRRR